MAATLGARGVTRGHAHRADTHDRRLRGGIVTRRRRASRAAPARRDLASPAHERPAPAPRPGRRAAAASTSSRCGYEVIDRNYRTRYGRAGPVGFDGDDDRVLRGQDAAGRRPRAVGRAGAGQAPRRCGRWRAAGSRRSRAGRPRQSCASTRSAVAFDARGRMVGAGPPGGRVLSGPAGAPTRLELLVRDRLEATGGAAARRRGAMIAARCSGVA